MSEMQELKCPGCGKEFAAMLQAEFKPELLTVAYKMDSPDRMMIVEDLCESLLGLAKSLQLTSKALGAPSVIVGLKEVSVIPGEVSVTVAVVMAKDLEGK